jgi:LacI family transcriptional regulator
MTTIKDVAKKAGVSVSTVSRVLNGYPHVDNVVRARVREVIQELDYQPNRVAQRLRAATSQLVGVIVSDIVNPFFIHAIRGIEHVFFQEDLSVLIGNADSDSQREEMFIRLMRREGASGLILAPTREDSPAVAEIVEARLPVVVIDRSMSNVAVDTVLTNNYKGAALAVEHLISLGHQRIGIISGPQHLTSGRERYRSYRHTLEQAGLPYFPNLVCFGDYRQSSGYELTSELLNLPEPPTALFVANNLMTIGALNAIHEMGRAIPDDIAVIGFDDLDWAVSLNPPLTTVQQPVFEIGVQAAHLLMERIIQPDQPARTIVLEPQLTIRASCGSLK